MGFELIDHTSEVGFRAYSESLEGVFDESAKAFSAVITDDTVKKRLSIPIDINEPSLKALFFEFLDTLVFLIDTKGVLIAGAKVSVTDDYSLKGVIYADYADNYDTHGDIKAPTYHGLFIGKENSLWIARAVLDV